MVRSYETSLKTSYLFRPVARALKGANKDFTILLRDLAGEVLEDVGASFANATRLMRISDVVTNATIIPRTTSG